MSACKCAGCGHPIGFVRMRHDHLPTVQELLDVGERNRELSRQEFTAMLILAASSIGMARRQLFELIIALPNRASDQLEPGDLTHLPTHIAVHEHPCPVSIVHCAKRGEAN